MIDSSTLARTRMVREQLERRGIRDPRVLEAMREIPRERFLRASPDRYAVDPYADGAIPIGRGQTLSQPFIVAAMAEALRLPHGARVLEIGTGTGYNTAVLAFIAREVWTVERDPVLGGEAKDRLEDLGIRNVRFRTGDGSLGWPEGAPYEGILVTAGAPDVPDSLVGQLAPGANLVIPVGSSRHQSLLRVTRDREKGTVTRERLMECRFVPLIGHEGWPEDDG